MRSVRITIILILAATFIYGQGTSRRWIGTSINGLYGSKLLAESQYSEEFNTIKNYNFKKPLTELGLLMVGSFHVIPYMNHNGNAFYSVIVPQKVNINDSINGFITGFNSGTSIYGLDLLRNNNKFDLLIDMGVNVGRLRFYGNSLIKQKNPYFSPKITFIPRVIIGKVSLQFLFEYDYDVSKKNWRRTYFSKSPKIELPKTNNSGLSCFFSLGYLIRN